MNTDMKCCPIVPKEAEIVRKIYSLYLQGASINSIIKKLKSEDTPDKIWSHNAIKYILTNERYIGDTLWQKSYTPNILPLRQKSNYGQLPKYYCEDTHEAIISKEDFYAVKRLMQERKERFYSTNKREKKFYNKKIKCRCCNWFYRTREIQNGYVWSCAKKGISFEKCPSRSYTDKAFGGIHQSDERQNDNHRFERRLANRRKT